MGAGRRRRADLGHGPRRDRGHHPRSRSDRHESRHGNDTDGVHERGWCVRAAEPPGGTVPAESRAPGLQHLHPRRHRPAGRLESRDQRDARRGQHQRAGDGHGQLDARRNAHDRRRTGHRQPARDGAAAEWTAGDGAHLPLRARHVGAGRRPQHEQELSDGHHLGRRRPGQRHHLHHGRRHAQRSVQQPEPADAVPRRAAGVQGRDQRAAGALRLPRRVRGEPGDQVRIEPGPRRPVRVHSRLPFQRAQLLRARARQPEAQPVRRHPRRADHQEQAVRLRRLPGPDREEQPADLDQLRADAGDDQRRLHRVRVGGLQRRHGAHADRRLRRQPHRRRRA